MSEMNLTDSLKLLRDYAHHGDEAAFSELVARYIDLVYSTAVRRVGGDAGLAEDVTQTVFADLARKARSLGNVELLGGWLHRHAGFVAATTVRREHLRQIREREAAQMNALNDSPDTLWQQMAPLVDEAIDALDAPDRQAIVLRFFERRDFRSIGAAFGISDDAAQKRVSRAVDKLRSLLNRRGISINLVLLSSLLAGRLVNAAPLGLAEKIAKLALVGAVSGGALTVIISKVANSTLCKLAAGGVIIAGVSWFALSNHSAPTHGLERQETTVKRPVESGKVPSAHPQAAIAEMDSHDHKVPVANSTLRLTIVADDNGQLVADVKLDYWLWENGKEAHKQPLQATSTGICEVPVPDDTTELLLVSQREGFADTRLEWRPDHGEQIPKQYVLRLARAVPIGGFVVNPDGEPVRGAKVTFGNMPNPALETRPQTDNFGWPWGLTTETDTNGHWQINRIGKAAIQTIEGRASHSGYTGSQWVMVTHSSGGGLVSRDSPMEKALLSGTYVFKLGHSITVRGVVKDQNGAPIGDAKVLIGYFGEDSSRRTTSQPDGSFSVSGCLPGTNLISAAAIGYAATTLKVELTGDSGPFQLVLHDGRVLKLRVVDPSGKPVPNATIGLETCPPGSVDLQTANDPPVQVEFSRKTGTNGYVEWDHAPNGELTFSVGAAGYMGVSFVKVLPSKTDHVFTLQPALTISGTVRDATTGEPIPRFRIVTGWPRWNPFEHKTNAVWIPLGDYWLNFGGGKFHYTYEAPPVVSTGNPMFIFKFLAKGYAPYVTRPVSASERNVQFDVTLKPQRQK